MILPTTRCGPSEPLSDWSGFSSQPGDHPSGEARAPHSGVRPDRWGLPDWSPASSVMSLKSTMWAYAWPRPPWRTRPPLSWPTAHTSTLPRPLPPSITSLFGPHPCSLPPSSPTCCPQKPPERSGKPSGLSSSCRLADHDPEGCVVVPLHPPPPG